MQVAGRERARNRTRRVEHRIPGLVRGDGATFALGLRLVSLPQARRAVWIAAVAGFADLRVLGPCTTRA
jgi:hypothetical protein